MLQSIDADVAQVMHPVARDRFAVDDKLKTLREGEVARGGARLRPRGF